MCIYIYYNSSLLHMYYEHININTCIYTNKYIYTYIYTYILIYMYIYILAIYIKLYVVHKAVYIADLNALKEYRNKKTVK